MRNSQYLFMAFILAACVGIGQAENLIINGGFETGDTTSWWTEQTGSASVAIDDTMSAEGGYSLQTISTGANWNDEARFGQYFEFEASVEGDEITIYFDYYSTSAGLIGINLDYYTDAKHWLGWSEFTPEVGVWTTYSVTYELPVGTYALDLKVIGTGEATINFDNFTTDPAPPSPIILTGPANGAEVGTDVCLSWSYDPTATVNTIDLYVGTEEDPNLTLDPLGRGYLILPNEPNETTSYCPTVSANKTYYWKVVGYEPNELGGSDIPVDSAVWSFIVTEAPEITSMSPYAQSVPGDGSVNATITAVGNNLGISTIVWSKDGTTLTDAGKYDGLGTAELTVKNVAFPGDEGVYTCYVSNGQGDATANAVLVTERLISWWKLDGDLDDSILDVEPDSEWIFDGVVDPNTEFTTDNSGIDGANSVVLDIDDPDCPVLKIDGTEEFFNFYQDSITISAWLRTSNYAWQGVLSKAPGESSGPVIALDDAGNVLVQADGADNRLSADWSLADGQWHMVTMTYDGYEQKIYVDGELGTVTDGTYFVSDISASGNLAPVIIGAWNEGAGDADFTGNIAHVKVYSKALTTTEIGEEYVAMNGNVDYVCNWEEEWLQFDVTGPEGQADCKVGLNDFAVFAESWLACNRIPQSACN